LWPRGRKRRNRAGSGKSGCTLRLRTEKAPAGIVKTDSGTGAAGRLGLQVTKKQKQTVQRVPNERTGPRPVRRRGGSGEFVKRNGCCGWAPLGQLVRPAWTRPRGGKTSRDREVRRREKSPGGWGGGGWVDRQGCVVSKNTSQGRCEQGVERSGRAPAASARRRESDRESNVESRKKMRGIL